MSDSLPVTVIIPAFNRPDMTRRAVRSALEQIPRPPAEVIVVDDCSTDSTGPVAAAAGAKVIRHERNQGEGAARNTGIAAATEPWIALLDSDDEWLPHLLSTLWPLRDSHILVAGAAMYRGPGPDDLRYSGPTRHSPLVLSSPAALIYPENLLPASAVLVRRDAVLQADGFNPGLRYGADLDLWMRVLELGTALLSERVVVDYHVHPGQVSQDEEEMARAMTRVLRAYEDRRWWSSWRFEGWLGGAAWDELKRQVASGQRRGIGRQGWLLARHPARLIGLAGILFRRHRMRRRTAELREYAARSDGANREPRPHLS